MGREWERVVIFHFSFFICHYLSFVIFIFYFLLLFYL
jgi:hypothetical protein